MSMNTRARVVATAASLCAAGGLAVAASGATGAYFTDANNGTVTGSIGTVTVATGGGSGADHLDFNFKNLMPGVAQSAKVTYKNTGSAPQDIYLTFPNADALHALNDLGSYGEVHIKSNGAEVFGSKNLSDKYKCGTESAGYPIICPVPESIKLASNVLPGEGGSATFSFNYAGKLKDPAAQGQPFNVYPLDNPTTSGLPYQIVATQAGHAPGE
jgi:hypothetical protein